MHCQQPGHIKKFCRAFQRGDPETPRPGRPASSLAAEPQGQDWVAHLGEDRDGGSLERDLTPLDVELNANDFTNMAWVEDCAMENDDDEDDEELKPREGLGLVPPVSDFANPTASAPITPASTAPSAHRRAVSPPIVPPPAPK